MLDQHSCLDCRNRAICIVFKGVQNPLQEWYVRNKKDKLIFSNETEIYQALAKTCYCHVPVLTTKKE